MDAKAAVKAAQNYTAGRLTLICDGKVLPEDKTLAECGVNSTSFLVAFTKNVSTTPATTNASTTKGKLTVMSRPAGTLTSHPAEVLHAVTKLHSGIRYGLFVVDSTNGLGENDVHHLETDKVTAIVAVINAARKDANAIRWSKHRRKPGTTRVGVPTLADVLFKKTVIIRRIISFTSVPQTSRLLITCKELYMAAQQVAFTYPMVAFNVQKLPTVCDMRGGDGLKMYRLMVRTLNSRWLEWLDTSEVKELKLPTSVTDEEMLIMFGGGKRFSELRTLGLGGCENITDASLSEVGRGCSNLQKLNLTQCRNITDASVSKVARGCSNLQKLSLVGCENITDVSLSEVGRGCLNLQTLILTRCFNITDASLVEIGRGCSNLQRLDLLGCRNITDAGLAALRQSHPKLRLVNSAFEQTYAMEWSDDGEDDEYDDEE